MFLLSISKKSCLTIEYYGQASACGTKTVNSTFISVCYMLMRNEGNKEAKAFLKMCSNFAFDSSLKL